MASLKDVAQKAGVSIATVSYVLNGTKKLSKEIEEKVKKAAFELNYQPNRAAQILRSGRTFNIALIMPDLSNPWFSELAHHITLKAQSLGFSVTIFTSLYDEKLEAKILSQMDKQAMMACLLVPISSQIDKNLQTPILLLDRQIKGWPCVSFDSYQGGMQQAQHAIDMKAKHVLILCNPHISSSARQRLKGIEDHLKGKAFYKIIHQDFTDKLSEEAQDYIKSQKADMVICAADIIASSVIRLAAQQKISIPQDLSLIGFDDIYYASILQPPLTTIKQDASQLAEYVLSAIAPYKDNKNEKIKFTSAILPTCLILRSSTKMEKT